jgi:hypothetical protein
VIRCPRPAGGPIPERGAGHASPSRCRALLAATLVAVSSVLATAPMATASDTCDGIWVVVDFGSLGGVETRCAPGSPQTGLEALQRAGFTYSFVKDQPGMVCTIDAKPDPCNGAPSHAYWSYWHAPQGGDWSYSTSGAARRTPPAGSVEGWAFGAGDAPRTAPPEDPPEPEPSPSPTASPSPTPSPTPTRTAEPAPTPRPTTEPDDAASAAAADPEPPAPSEDVATADPDLQDDAGPTDGPDEDASAATAAPRPPAPTAPRERAGQTPAPSEPPPVELRDADDQVALDRPGDGGAMAGLIAGGALAATIAGAGVFQARRRRQELGP